MLLILTRLLVCGLRIMIGAMDIKHWYWVGLLAVDTNFTVLDKEHTWQGNTTDQVVQRCLKQLTLVEGLYSRVVCGFHGRSERVRGPGHGSIWRGLPGLTAGLPPNTCDVGGRRPQPPALVFMPDRRPAAPAAPHFPSIVQRRLCTKNKKLFLV